MNVLNIIRLVLKVKKRMEEQSKFEAKILNHMRRGRTASGRVGAKVSPTGENPNNHAWITIFLNRAYDAVLSKTEFLSYEVEYLELAHDYDEAADDYDRYYVRKEIFYNIEGELALELVVSKWLSNVGILAPAANIGHPVF